MNNPKIGIFWYHKGKVIAYSCDLKIIEPDGDYYDYEVAHYEVWEQLRNQNSQVADLEYDELPRGRIVFNKTDNMFYILTTDKLFTKQSFLLEICQKFNLGEADIKFKADDRYFFSIDHLDRKAEDR